MAGMDAIYLGRRGSHYAFRITLQGKPIVANFPAWMCYSGGRRTGVAAPMDEAHRLALTLAQTAETSMGYPAASAVVERATIYLNFLYGVSDDKPDDARAAPGGGSQGFG